MRELRLHVEGADGLNLAAEEVDTVRPLVGVGEDVHDAAPDGVLPGLVDVVRLREAVRVQDVGDEQRIDPLARVQLEGVLLQGAARGDALGHGVGVADDDELRAGRLQGRECLRAEHLVGRIRVAVFNVALVSRGEEADAPLAQELHEVVVEIAGLLEVVHQAEQAPLEPAKECRSADRAARSVEPGQEHIARIAPLDERSHGADLRVGCVEGL